METLEEKSYSIRTKVTSMMRIIDSVIADYYEVKRPNESRQLIWFEEVGVGWFPVFESEKIISQYYSNFNRYKKTKMGIEINRFRAQLVLSHTNQNPIDIGIGAGHFIETYDLLNKNGESAGYDVSKEGIDWLRKKHKYVDYLQIRNHKCLTFWDSFEHIELFKPSLDCVADGGYVFMTIPIIAEGVSPIHSKHFKKHEHYWYFTANGIVNVMNANGFDFIASSDREVELGREEVRSFVFKKKRK